MRKIQFSKHAGEYLAWDTGEKGTDDGNSIQQLEVKIDDLLRTL